MLTTNQKKLAYICSSFFAFCAITGLSATKENQSLYRQAYVELYLGEIA